MSFETEPAGYAKTALSDLQGAWENLRSVVVESYGFANSDKLLFHIDEGMSWESVRDLKKMKSALLLIRNIAAQSSAPLEVIEWVDEVSESLDAVIKEIAEGKVK